MKTGLWHHGRAFVTTRRVVLIEDSEIDAKLVLRELTEAGYTIVSEQVDTEDALVEALERHGPWDIALADYTMPRFSGTAALAVLRDRHPEMPFIFVSGTIGEDIAVEAMRAGAHDYIMKGNLKRLVPAVERELREAAVRRSRRRAEERLVHLAYHDLLTDLPNRVLLHDRLQQAVLNSLRTHEPLAVMVLDLDGFKMINDAFGHRIGDSVLQQVATRLRELVRDVDTVARLGGDEFALVLPRTDGDQAVLIARKVLQAFAQPFVVGDSVVALSGSFGVAWMPEHGSNTDALLQKADDAMYVAKSGGFGISVYAPERDRQAHRTLAAMTELREGIERDEFLCEYQPIVSLHTDTVIGIEALARWRHPRRGLLLPSEFIDLSERTGLIEPLTLLLLEKALGEWTRPGFEWTFPVAVNLSVRSLRDPELPDRIADVLHLHDAPPSMLVLEITESVIMKDPLHCRTCLCRLHDKGVRLVIDDFGTGHSSLSYLQHLPVDELKIDRSFVMRLTDRDDVIVHSTIELAHKLGLKVVAEGVESAAVLERLRELGCDAAQGIFIARPGPAQQIRRWVAHGVRS
jgi:diguanylate cyclase (GGDEF)-like protein